MFLFPSSISVSFSCLSSVPNRLILDKTCLHEAQQPISLTLCTLIKDRNNQLCWSGWFIIRKEKCYHARVGDSIWHCCQLFKLVEWRMANCLHKYINACTLIYIGTHIVQYVTMSPLKREHELITGPESLKWGCLALWITLALLFLDRLKPVGTDLE